MSDDDFGCGFRVERNRCRCHPETCNCKDWAIFKGTEKHSTYFKWEIANEVCDALNFKRLAKMIMRNY